MGTSLTGLEIKDTYDSLIKVTDNGPLTGSLKKLTDGLGNDSSLSLSTTAASLSGTLAVSGNATFDTSTLVVDAANNRVGVGVATPNQSFEVASIAQFNGSGLDGNLAEAVLFANSTFSTVQKNRIRSSISAAANGNLLVLEAGTATVGTYNNNQLVLRGDGNVGIGTSSPTSSLDVVSAGTGVAEFEGPANATVSFKGVGFVEGLIRCGGEFTIGSTNNFPITFLTNNTEKVRIAATGEVSVGSTNTQARFNVAQTAAARITGLTGNSNDQGTAQNYRVVRHYPVVSLGTKLIIPFTSQGSLNGNTIVRLFGHGATFNNADPIAFTLDFAVGHLSSLSNLTNLASTGNVASIAVNGMNVEITFTTAYTSATADGIYVTIDYMTNDVTRSVVVANIAMN